MGKRREVRVLPHSFLTLSQSVFLFFSLASATAINLLSQVAHYILHFSKGECRIVDPQNNYQILQKNERDLFENPRLWFGIGTMNVEMTLKPFALKKNSEMSANISWSFSN